VATIRKERERRKPRKGGKEAAIVEQKKRGKNPLLPFKREKGETKSSRCRRGKGRFLPRCTARRKKKASLSLTARGGKGKGKNYYSPVDLGDFLVGKKKEKFPLLTTQGKGGKETPRCDTAPEKGGRARNSPVI